MREFFGAELFRTWPIILFAALVFASLFGLAASMVDMLFGHDVTISSKVGSFFSTAFVGFVLIAGWIRMSTES